MLQKALRHLSSTPSQKKIGFLGLGNMGISMSRHLVNSGFHVNGFDLNQKSLTNAERNGITPANSIAEAVKNVDYVITCLPRTSDVQNALSDPVDGVFKWAD